MSLRRQTFAPFGSAPPRVLHLEDRTVPAQIAVSGTSAQIVADVPGETVSLRTAQSDFVTISSDMGLTLNGTPLGTGNQEYQLQGARQIGVSDAASGTRLRFGDGAADYLAGFTVTLDDGPAEVSFGGRSAFSGASLDLFANGGVTVNSGAKVSASGGGSITLNGNNRPDTASAAGSFDGLLVLGDISVAGAGRLTLQGRGGSLGGFGVNVRTATANGGTTPTRIEGIGGAGGLFTRGVTVAHEARVRSAGGLFVTGIGGNGSRDNLGIQVAASGAILADGSGDVTVVGTGGSGPGDGNRGVVVSGAGSRVGSAQGSVTVFGSGGAGPGGSNYGVHITDGGQVAARDAGLLVLGGTGGGLTGLGGQNHGVVVNGRGSTVSTLGGALFVLGSSAASGDNFGVVLAGEGTVTGGPFGPVALFSDRIALDATAAVAGSGATVRGLELGRAVDLGGADSATALGLDATEVARITAADLTVGNEAGGEIVVSRPINRAFATNLRLMTASRVVTLPGNPIQIQQGGVLVSAPGGFDPYNNGVDVNAALRFAAGSVLDISVSGPTPDSGYTRVAGLGSVDLSGVTLSLRGGYVAQTGETFILVSTGSRIGTFAGLPDGAIVRFNGRLLRIGYTPTNAFMTAL